MHHWSKLLSASLIAGCALASSVLACSSQDTAAGTGGPVVSGIGATTGGAGTLGGSVVSGTTGDGGASTGVGGAALGGNGGQAMGGSGGGFGMGGATSSTGVGGSLGGGTGSGGAMLSDPIDVVSSGTAADIYVDADDSPSVVRAVGDLKEDVTRVSGASPAVKNTTMDLSSTAILVGTLGRSPVIDELAAAGKLDVEGVTSKWESFVIQAVPDPVVGVSRGLVIAGSDRRGTIYGVYELSQRMGVSPWYWWADIVPAQSDTVTVEGAVSKQGEPSVQYRGIFINDEENLATWSAAKMDSGKKMGPETYKRVFELLLRLKANFLWPAMHDVSDEFNRYPENAENADLYGIVMGSSHPEMLLRNNVKEWEPWAESHKVGGSTPVYDYSVNPDSVYDYWDDRVEQNGKYENGYSVGMRGIHDSGLPAKNAPTTADKLALMEKIFADQREILSQRVSTDLKSILQLFTPYKEVLSLYNAGLQVPDDVTIIWAEDNHGYIRQLSTQVERMRSGGSGVYYHLSYWGDPISYLWVCSTPPALVYEEMQKAYDSDARRLWLANVGDIKPAEIATEFFLRLAWNVEDFTESNLTSVVAAMAARDFGAEHAAEIADIVMRTFQLNIARRPEFMDKDVFNLVNYGDEAQKRLDELTSLLDRATAIYDSLPEAKRDGFYELVLYTIRASKFQNEKYIAAAKADLYARQGRTQSVTKYRTETTDAYDMVRSDLDYFTSELAGGKWQKVINPYNSAQPTIPGLPSMASAPAPSGQALGVAYEGQTTGAEDLPLDFSAYTQDRRFIDIFTKGSSGFNWTATSEPAWIALSSTSGTIADEERIWASIDWAAVPSGSSSGTITVSSGSASKTIPVNVNSPASPSRSELEGYVEANGYVAIEAEHFTEKADRGGAEWRVLSGLGRSGDSVKVFPDISERITGDYAANSAELAYRIYFFSTGTFPVTVFRVPTLSGSGNCELGVAVDSDDVEILRGADATDDRTWDTNVIEQIEKLSTTIRVTTPGYHTLRLFKVDPSIVVDRIVIDTGGLRPSYLGPPESYHQP